MYKKGNLDQAIADYSQAIALDPKNADAYTGRGLALRDSSRLEQALADFNKAIDLDPKNANAFLGRGLTYQRQNQNPQAVADFEMYLKLAPNALDRNRVQQLINQLR